MCVYVQLHICATSDLWFSHDELMMSLVVNNLLDISLHTVQLSECADIQIDQE